MRMQRIFCHILITFTLALLMLPVFTYADVSSGGLGASFPNPINKANINAILTALLDFVTAVGAVLAVLFTVYAGFLFVTARGNESQLEKAKQTLFWTLVGAVIVLGAFALAEVIENTANELKG